MAPAHDIFVVGTSAGGVEALTQLVSSIPADFPGALFVVLHIPARTSSVLPAILARVGHLPASHPADGEKIEPGKIYVAPPDHHLLIERDHIRLTLGPKEQHHRPCINVMFRSAAEAYGQRVTGVILTGELDDGTAGLWEVKRRGGLAVIQDPDGAPFPSMPLSALRDVSADYVVKLREMGPLLTRLASENGLASVPRTEVVSTNRKMTDLTCPDCKGTIWVSEKGPGREYRCRVGHTFSPRSMLSEHAASQEKALYSALVSLEEGASLAVQLAGQFEGPTGERLRSEARERESQAAVLRQILKERSLFILD